MGNSESVSIDIKIDWEREGFQVVYAGRKLKGEVIVDVKKMVVDAAPIKLIISGKEKASLKVRKREQMHLTEADRRFFSVTLPLRAFQDKRRIPPGVYTFPFSLKLPRSLPSTDKHPETKAKAKVGYAIEYRMTAKMGQLHKEMYFDVTSAPLPPEKIPCLIRPTQHRIHTMGVKEDGQIVLGAMVNNSVVGRGKNIELFLACRNDSVANIRCVEIQIVEFLRWTLGPKPETQDCSKVLKTIKSVALPSTCKPKKREEVGKVSTGSMFKEIHQELRSRRDPVLISVPDTARDTYRGRLVNVWHCLKVSFLTRSVSNNATAIVPIQIGHPPLKQKHHHHHHHHHNGTKASSQPEEAARTPPINSVVPVQPGKLASVPENGAEQELTGGNQAFPVMVAPEDLIILGADKINRRERNDSDTSSVVTAPPEAQDVEVSVKSLLASMESAVSDYDLILGRLMDRRWAKLFARITPSEFGKVVAAVKVEVDQPRVAVMLAPNLNGTNNFTCEYAAAAVKHCSVSYRSVTTKRLLPMCVDIREKYKLILNELNEWERIATSNEFEEALLASATGQ